MTSSQGPLSSTSLTLSPEAEEQKRVAMIQKAVVALRTMRGARPFLAGGVIGSTGISALQIFLERPIGESIGLPGISMGGLVALGAFVGSLVFGGAVSFAGIIRYDPMLQHYLGVLEVWLKYQQGRMSPKQYYEHGAVLDYQRLYGHHPPDARPKMDAYVRDVLRWKAPEIQKATAIRNQKMQAKTAAKPVA